MKRRVCSALLSLCLLCALLPAALAQEDTAPVTALCVSAPGESALLDTDELQFLCRQATRHDLEYVTFSALSTSVGQLTCKGERVAPNEPYYMYESPQLTQIRFTPYAYHSRQFTGQGEVAFTMTDEKGNTVPGKLLLYVPEETEPPAENRYMDKVVTAEAGQAIDLTDVLPNELWYKSRSSTGGHTVSSAGDGWYYIGDELTAATFALPSSDQGALWLDYGWSTARKVLPEEVLFPDREPNFYNVTFVPADRKERTVKLRYTADGDKKQNVPATLTLRLLDSKAPGQTTSTPAYVSASPAVVSTCTSQAGLATALHNACASRGLGELESVAFDVLPAAEDGVILSVDTPVSAGTVYPYGSLSFRPGETFQGDIALRYVGTDSMEFSFPGTLFLELDYPPEGRFQDLTGWEWAAYAVQFLDMRRAVEYRRSEPLFHPGEPADRMEFVYALVQAAYYQAAAAPAPDFSDLPSDPKLVNAVSVAVAHGLLQGDGEKRLRLDEQVTRQDALVMIHRALAELGWELPPAADLSVYSDAEELSPYAREAAGVLQAMGVLQGDGSGRLSPRAPITRAEMACLIYRAFA